MNARLLALCILMAASSVTSAADLQAKRKAFIAEMVKMGVLYKVDKPASLCHAWVGPRFDGLTYDQKSNGIGVVYAYCLGNDPGASIVRVVDYRTGKDIGTYSAVAGGLRLK